jgi:integrative and conjugative element protein (TIGR02256 family)
MIAGVAHLEMRFHRVILLPQCLSVIRAESHKARGVETGGPLVGYVGNDGALVVADATGPGPRARLEHYSVTIDGKYAQEFCDRVNRESNGHIDYVGDWHKHPGFSLRPSEHDVDAMKTMAQFPFSPTRHPISLIYRMWPRSLRVYVWDGSGVLADITPTTRVERRCCCQKEKVPRKKT